MAKGGKHVASQTVYFTMFRWHDKWRRLKIICFIGSVKVGKHVASQTTYFKVFRCLKTRSWLKLDTLVKRTVFLVFTLYKAIHGIVAESTLKKAERAMPLPPVIVERRRDPFIPPRGGNFNNYKSPVSRAICGVERRAWSHSKASEESFRMTPSSSLNSTDSSRYRRFQWKCFGAYL